MSRSNKNSRRNVWVDTLRGIAALAVVWHHLLAETKYQGNWLLECAKYGRHGVEVFFFISGFCVQAASYRVRGAAEFFWHRFWRIFPPYYLSLAAMIGAGLVHKLLIGPFGTDTFPKTASDLLAVLGIMTHPATPVVAVSWVNWTLTYELFFYLIIGFSMVTRARYVTLFVVSALGFFSASLHTVPGLFFVDFWCIYALGAAFFEFCAGRKLLGACLGVINTAAMVINHPPLVNVIVAVTLLTVAFSTYRPSSPLGRRNLLTKVGAFSYSLYLLHCPVGVSAWFGAQTKWGLTEFPMNLLYYLVLFALCMLAAWISYLLVEKPSLRMAKAYATAEERIDRWLPFLRRKASATGGSIHSRTE